MTLITVSIDFRWNECKSRLLGLFNFKISSRHISWSLYLFKRLHILFYLVHGFVGDCWLVMVLMSY